MSTADMTRPPKGLLVNIYRHSGGDSSNSGISSWADRVILVGPGIPEISEATEQEPAVELHQTVPGHVCARPVDEVSWCMFGGAFIYTSDGRFPAQHPIPLHDRVESAALAEVLSR